MKKSLRSVVVAVVARAVEAVPDQAALDLYAESDYRDHLDSFSNPMRSYRNMSRNANDTLSSYWFAFGDDNKVSSFQLGRGC